MKTTPEERAKWREVLYEINRDYDPRVGGQFWTRFACPNMLDDIDELQSRAEKAEVELARREATEMDLVDTDDPQYAEQLARREEGKE